MIGGKGVRRVVFIGLSTVLGMGLTACQRLDEGTAREVLTAYNGKVIQAFKEGKSDSLRGVAGPSQVERMERLIQARRQKDLTLESRLEDLEVLGVRRSRGAVTVRTKERWCYCDRQASTGQFVGTPSEDVYQKAYTLKRRGRKWMVEKVELTAPPEPVRSPGPWKESAPDAGGPEGSGESS